MKFSGLRKPKPEKTMHLEDKDENGEELDEPSLFISPHPHNIKRDGPNNKISELGGQGCSHESFCCRKANARSPTIFNDSTASVASCA